MFRLNLPHWIALCLPLLLAACGGGGGGSTNDTDQGAAPVTDFGSFHYAAIGADTDPDHRGHFGTWTIAPDLSVDVEITTNEDQQVGAAQTSSATLVMEGGGRFRITQGVPTIFRGYYAANREVGLIATSLSLNGAQPTVGAFVRVGSSWRTSDLEGDWHTVNASYDSMTAARRVDPAKATFLRAGSVETPPGYQFNSNGNVFLSVTPRAEPFVLTQNGRAFMNPDNRQGGITADGELLIVSGGTPGPVDPSPAVGFGAHVRASTAATNATFQGRYGFVRLIRRTVGYEATSGVVIADGAGGLRFENLERNLEGTLDQPVTPATGTYSVATDGRLDFTPLDTNGVFRGGVSPSGRYAVLGGSISVSSPTGFWILVRLD